MGSVSSRPLVWTVPAAAGLCAAVLSVAGLNEGLFHALNAAASGGAALWSSVTVMGDALFVLVLFLPFVVRRPDIVWAAILAALVATFASHVFKELLELPRPAAVLDRETMHIIGPVLKKHAFPSGHATAAFTFASVVALRLARAPVSAAVITLAAIVALSRVVVAAHWPVDVFGGAAVGWLSGLAAVTLAERWRWGLRCGPQRAFGLFLLGCAVWLFVYDTGYPLGIPIQRVAAVACIAVAAWNVWRQWAGEGSARKEEGAAGKGFSNRL